MIYKRSESSGAEYVHCDTEIPVLFASREDCCGCSACYSVCPANAIEMCSDAEGFPYPKIHPQKCINCKLCLAVCGYKKDLRQKSLQNRTDISEDQIMTEAYAVRINNSEVLMRSSSGGAFTAISDWFLDQGYAIACCVYNYSSHKAEFCLIESKRDRDNAVGSKYMYSYLGDVFTQCMRWLESNPDKQLLFVGMGCQAAGFCNYAAAKGMRQKVTVVDIICHGMPSPVMWDAYVEYLCGKSGKTIEWISFRDKRKGWENPTAIAKMNGKEVSLKGYMRLFYDARTLRPACYKCPYATVQRYTDITIGDFWHIEKALPSFCSEKGNSLVLLHSEKGKKLFSNIAATVEYCKTDTTNCLQYSLQYPAKETPGREVFWKEYHTFGSEYMLRKYANLSISRKIINRIRNALNWK